MSNKSSKNSLQQQNTTAVRYQAVERSFSGPLPPPEALARYDAVVAGSAERIIRMAENQNAHRLALEKTVVTANVAAQKNGVMFGFIIAMTAILGGIYLVATGKPATGLAAILSSLAALVGVFVYGKMAQKKDLSNKA